MKRYLPFALILAVILIGTAVFFWISQPEQVQPIPMASVPAGGSSPASSTNPRGSVLLEEFGDYQCPPCGSLHPLIKTLKSEYGDRLKLVFYQFPLIAVHKNALTAAHAAIAAKQQGKFWEMHNMLYENQAAWSELPDLRPVVTNFAIQLGLDVNRFVKDLDSPDIAAMVEADMQRGANFRVTSTPTLFINGQPVPNEKISLDYFRNEINERLK